MPKFIKWSEYKMGRKKTHEQFLQQVYELTGDEYTVLGKYEGSNIKIKIKHNLCGRNYEITPKNFLRGDKCRVCAMANAGKRKTQTTDHVIEKINKLYGKDAYILLSPFKGSKYKIKVKHTKCGRINEHDYNNFMHGHGCPYCAGNSKHTYIEVKERIEKNKGFKLLSNCYINTKTKLLIECPYKHHFKMAFAQFQHGQRCPKCLGKQKTFAEVKNYIHSFNYKLLSNCYINNSTKLKIECSCKHIFYMDYAHFKRGERCSKCSSSSSQGENLLRYILHNMLPSYIDFEEEYPVTIDGHLRRYDFIIPSYKILIEYDGEQHYNDSTLCVNTLKERKYIDKIKDDWAKNNHFILIRFSYLDNDSSVHKRLFNLLKYEYGINCNFNYLDYQKARLTNNKGKIIQNAVKYYLNHSLKAVIEKYCISDATIEYYFKKMHGCSRREYKRQFNHSKEIVKYYLNHSLNETANYFKINQTQICNYFKDMYHISKRQYLKKVVYNEK
jgi:AraC-like DNA-binding protein